MKILEQRRAWTPTIDVLPQALYWGLIIYLLFVLNINPQLNPSDDYQVLSTLQSGHLLNPFIDPMLGRFCPFLAGEYNLITRFLPATPATYFFYNSLQLLIFAVLAPPLCSKATKGKALIYIVLFLFITNAGFLTAWLRLFIGERNVVFWFTIFLLGYLNYSERQKPILFFLIVAAAGIAILYKEPAFLALATFVFLHLISTWKITNWKSKLLDFLLLLFSAGYALSYYFIVYVHRGTAQFNYAAVFGMQSFTKTADVFFDTDPLLLLFLVPVVCWRLYLIVIRRKAFEPIYDSMLAAAFIYMAAFFVLGLPNTYYLLPSYIFAIPPLLYFLAPRNEPWTDLKLRYLFIAFVLFVNYSYGYKRGVWSSVFPWSLQTINKFKYVAQNYAATLDYLTAQIRNNQGKERLSFFLNLDRNSGYEGFYSFTKFLEYRGLQASQFDFKFDLAPKTNVMVSPTRTSPYSFINSAKPSQMKQGDFLIVLPMALYAEILPTHERLQVDKSAPFRDCLNAITPEYKLVFRTDNDVLITIKNLTGINLNPTPKSELLCAGDPNYYVFVRQ